MFICISLHAKAEKNATIYLHPILSAGSLEADMQSLITRMRSPSICQVSTNSSVLPSGLFPNVDKQNPSISQMHFAHASRHHQHHQYMLFLPIRQGASCRQAAGKGCQIPARMHQIISSAHTHDLSSVVPILQTTKTLSKYFKALQPRLHASCSCDSTSRHCLDSNPKDSSLHSYAGGTLYYADTFAKHEC